MKQNNNENNEDYDGVIVYSFAEALLGSRAAEWSEGLSTQMEAHAVEINQNWDSETTEYVFSDSSKLLWSGANVEVGS